MVVIGASDQMTRNSRSFAVLTFLSVLAGMPMSSAEAEAALEAIVTTTHYQRAAEVERQSY